MEKIEPRWINYVPPASHTARAIQYPIDARWPDRVINAYAKDASEARAALAGVKP